MTPFYVYFSFIEIIREELNSVKEDWNTHTVSRSNIFPTWRPSCLYQLPHLYDRQDCVLRINKEEIDEFVSFVSELQRDFTPEFTDFARTAIFSNGIKTPKNPSEALNLYLVLLEKIDQ